jgi:hypothetical protein
VFVISKEYYDSNKLFFYKRVAHILPIFVIGKILLNIVICQTLEIPVYSKAIASEAKSLE